MICTYWNAAQKEWENKGKRTFVTSVIGNGLLTDKFFKFSSKKKKKLNVLKILATLILDQLSIRCSAQS